jgi:hypothetical protein
MVLILILAALAAVYYIAAMADSAVNPGRGPRNRDAVHGVATPGAAGVLTPGLVALGRALDQYGRGQEPRPGGDGVGEEVRKTERDRL